MRLFRICAQPKEGPYYAEHYEGIAMGILHAVHGYCLSCGVNHDKEASEL